MDAAEDGAGRLTTAMRVVLVAFLVLAGLAFILLYLRSGHTGSEFAWTIRPGITAAFLGAGYGAGCVLVASSLRQRPWAEVRVGIGIVLVFSAMILVTTLLHLERFHFGAANGGITRGGLMVAFGAALFVAPGCSSPPGRGR
jgi:peptidoglycan/LPS O-acetylase OafA/YrhL